jgi:hypothetical protein
LKINLFSQSWSSSLKLTQADEQKVGAELLYSAPVGKHLALTCIRLQFNIINFLSLKFRVTHRVSAKCCIVCALFMVFIKIFHLCKRCHFLPCVYRVQAADSNTRLGSNARISLQQREKEEKNKSLPIQQCCFSEFRCWKIIEAALLGVRFGIECRARVKSRGEIYTSACSFFCHSP